MTREQFLDKYLTVVTKKDAVKEQDDKAKAFVKKYLTQVGCPSAEPGPEPTKYAVTFKKGSGSGDGTVTASAAEFAEGENVVLTVTPAAGSELKSLTGKDEHDTPVSIDLNDFEFVMPASAVEVEYNFAKLPPEPTTYGIDFTLTSGNGTCVSDKERYAEGEEVVLTITPVSGALKKLYGEDEDYNKITIDPEDPRFEMPASDVRVFYGFEE